MQGLGANEKAVLERIPFLLLRKFAAGMVRAKMRVQFTGWLQYLLPIIPITVAFLLAGVSYLLKISILFRVFSAIGLVISLNALFDLVTVKFKLRFPERLPKGNDNLDPFDLMRTRRSCRSFQTRKLTDADHAKLVKSVQRHLEEPGIGESPIRFEYISDPIKVWPVVNATEFLVAIAPKEYERLAVIDVGRSLQKVVMDATRTGLGTCWIGPGADHASVIQNLGERFDPGKDHIICICALGYRSNYIPIFLRIFNTQFNRRLRLSQLFFADADLTRPLNVNAAPFKRFGRNYEACQWAPSSYNGQTTRCVAVTDENGALISFDFYAATASMYYAPVALGIWAANWEIGCEVLSIQGHFAVLRNGEKDTLPVYYLSWIAD